MLLFFCLWSRTWPNLPHSEIHLRPHVDLCMLLTMPLVHPMQISPQAVGSIKKKNWIYFKLANKCAVLYVPIVMWLIVTYLTMLIIFFLLGNGKLAILSYVTDFSWYCFFSLILQKKNCFLDYSFFLDFAWGRFRSFKKFQCLVKQ